MQNTLYYGDNLNVLREQIPGDSVELIYLDAPFNSARNYNLLFKQVKGGIQPGADHGVREEVLNCDASGLL